MPGLLRGMARTAAVVGTASAVSGRVARHQQQKYAAEDQQQMAATQPTAPSQDNSQQFAELEKLGQLKEKGIITQAEFDAKKAQILGL